MGPDEGPHVGHGGAGGAGVSMERQTQAPAIAGRQDGEAAGEAGEEAGEGVAGLPEAEHGALLLHAVTLTLSVSVQVAPVIECPGLMSGRPGGRASDLQTLQTECGGRPGRPDTDGPS